MFDANPGLVAVYPKLNFEDKETKKARKKREAEDLAQALGDSIKRAKKE